jgi:hypothetical protein
MSAEDAVRRAVELVELAERHGVTMRIVGGAATTYLCGTGRSELGDIDFVASPKHRRALEAAMADDGAVGDREFNHLHGHQRLYYQGSDGVVIDIFMGRMDMCHTLDLRSRLELAKPCVPAADLVLSKLQIVEFTEKDRQDTQTLLEHLPIDERHDAIDPRRIQEVTSEDWGWHHTVATNLEEFASVPGVAGERAGALLGLMEQWPKSRRWNRRARVGTRKPWYRLPEEVAHGSAAGGA